MRVYALLFSSLLLLCLAAPCLAQDTAKPESIVGRMAYKFTSGVTNVATSVVEIPKQSYLSVRDQGALGVVVGPLKGVGMMVYRILIGGIVETAFFTVPQPGYYDPALDPEFVWDGWEKQHFDYENPREVGPQETVSDKSGE